MATVDRDVRVGCEVGQGGWCELVYEAPEVYLIRVPYPNITTNSTNCYLVRDGEDSLLIDTGAPSDGAYEALAEALDLIGAPKERMSFFLTHLHMDHAGLVDRVVPCDRPLYVGRVDYELTQVSLTDEYKNLMTSWVASEGVESYELSGFVRNGLGFESFLPEEFDIEAVDPGDTIRVGSTELRVVDTAGHTPGHLSLFEPKSGVFFGGDHVLFVVSPVLGVRPGITDTMEKYLKNLRKLEAMGVSKLFHSHGPLRDDWLDRARWLAEHHENRMKATAEIVAHCPGLTGEGVVRRMKWSARVDVWDKIPIAKRWCIMECGIASLDWLVNNGIVRRETDESGVHRYFAC